MHNSADAVDRRFNFLLVVIVLLQFYIFSVLYSISMVWLNACWIFPMSLGLLLSLILRKEFQGVKKDFRE